MPLCHGPEAYIRQMGGFGPSLSGGRNPAVWRTAEKNSGSYPGCPDKAAPDAGTVWIDTSEGLSGGSSQGGIFPN